MVIINLEELSKIDSLIFKYNKIEITKSFLKQDMNDEIEKSEINYLLEKGTILASSNKYKNRNRALNIATIIPNVCDNIEYIAACKNILNKLRNFNAVEILNRKYPEVSNKYISVVDEIRQEYEKISNTEDILDQEVVFNNTQCTIYRLFNENKDISVSAPTSIGKSFVVIMSLVKKINEINKNIVYVVPTRALINQVIEDIRKNLDGDYFVTSSPDTSNIDRNRSGIFVLTQERLYNLCNNNDIDIELLIIDEAQNIKSGSRGVLLEYSIKYAKKIWKNIKVIYISPLIKNPSRLLSNENKENSFFSKESLVRQNIIKLVRIKFGGYEVKLKNKTIKEKIKINRGRNLSEAITNVYCDFNNGEKSIIYCSEPSMIKRVCKELCNRDDINEKNNERLNEFANFISKYIHKNYLLVKCLKKGIAFHYGSLPSFIRMGIEELAKDGLIDIIVCTSTLLQGINIPAQNIYICNPRAGRGNKFDDVDFWNLVGRAGRIRYDLCGNIILVDTDSWDSIDKYDNRNIELKYATELNQQQISSLEDSLVNENHAFNPFDDKEKEFVDTMESALVFDNILGGEKIDLRSPDIETYINTVTDKYQEISSLLIKLMGIRAVNIQKVWDIFEKNDSEIEEWMSVSPYNDEFISRFSKIIKLINENILDGTLYAEDEENEKINKSFNKILYCSNSWIRGNSIKSIIFYKFDNFDDEDEVTNIVQSQIKYLNQVVRYKLVKGMYAYQEILKEYLIFSKREKLIEKLPNIAMFLEIGTCDDIAIELISLGLIRELAIEISKNNKIDKSNLVKSLKSIDLSNSNINKYSLNRIDNFINNL